MDATIRVEAEACALCGTLYPKPDARERRYCSPACRYRAWALAHRHTLGRKPGRPRGGAARRKP